MIDGTLLGDLKFGQRRNVIVNAGSAAFVLLLLGAHGVGEFSRRLAEPLSMFRDGEQAWLGYVLFATLLVVNIWYTRDLIRAGDEKEAVIAGLAAMLLFIVAVTPSLD